MTIIGYARDVLAADSRAVHLFEDMGDSGLLSAVQMTKLRVLGQERVAVAVCGPIPSDQDWELLGKIYLFYCTALEHLHPDKQTITFSEEHTGLGVFHNRFPIAMTREHVYLVIRENGGDTKAKATGLLKLTPAAQLSFGTGSTIANVAYAAGMNADQAAHFVIEQDHLTGPPVLSVQRGKLQPITLAPPGENVLAPVVTKKKAKK